MSELKVTRKLTAKERMSIIKKGCLKGTGDALKDPVEWAIAITTGTVTGVKDKDRNKGLITAALLMSKSIIVKSVEESVAFHKEYLEEEK